MLVAAPRDRDRGPFVDLIPIRTSLWPAGSFPIVWRWTRRPAAMRKSGASDRDVALSKGRR